MPNRLKELRKQKGNTQAEVAKILGTNQSQYGKCENERTQLSLDNAKFLPTTLVSLQPIYWVWKPSLNLWNLERLNFKY